MAELQVFEGTTEDIAKLLQNGAFAGSKLKLIVNPAPIEAIIEDTEEEDLSDSYPDPPITIRDKAHLEELLLAGINSPTRRVTEQTWEETRQEVHRRHAAWEKSRQP